LAHTQTSVIQIQARLLLVEGPLHLPTRAAVSHVEDAHLLGDCAVRLSYKF